MEPLGIWTNRETDAQLQHKLAWEIANKGPITHI